MKFAKVTIDGVEHTLAYDFNEICKAEEYTGCNLLGALQHLNELHATELRGLFLAALEAGPEQAFPGKSPQDALEEAGKLIRLDTVIPIIEALSKAYQLSLPENSEADTTIETA